MRACEDTLSLIPEPQAGLSFRPACVRCAFAFFSFLRFSSLACLYIHQQQRRIPAHFPAARSLAAASVARRHISQCLPASSPSGAPFPSDARCLEISLRSREGSGILHIVCTPQSHIAASQLLLHRWPTALLLLLRLPFSSFTTTCTCPRTPAQCSDCTLTRPRVRILVRSAS